MEQFTNNADLFREKIKQELLDFSLELHWKIEFKYIEMPSFLNYAFSFLYLSNAHERKIIFKKYKTNLNIESKSLGIYNLSRLPIISHEFEVKNSSVFDLSNVDEINTVKFEGAVLDGLYCKMLIPKINGSFIWNIDEEMNNELSTIVNKIRSQIAHFI